VFLCSQVLSLNKCALQVAQLQADVGHYQGQAETALTDSEGWQQNVQELRTELAEKAGHAAEFGNMQAEVLPSALLHIGTCCQHQQDRCCFRPLSHASVHFLYPVFLFLFAKKDFEHDMHQIWTLVL